MNPDCNVCAAPAVWDTPTIWSGYLAFLCEDCYPQFGTEGGVRLTRPTLTLV